MKSVITLRKSFTLIVFLFLFIALILTLYLSRKSQDIRKKASSSSVVLSIYPSASDANTLNINEVRVFELKALFSDPDIGEKIDGIDLKLHFPNGYLYMPSGQYIDTTPSGLDKTYRVDGPVVANNTGDIIIKMVTSIPDGGPPVAQAVTLARIYLAGKAVTPSDQFISIVSGLVYTNKSNGVEIPATYNPAYFRITNTVNPTVTSGPTNATEPTAPVDVTLPVTTPGSGNEEYSIDIGDKNSLSIDIGEGTGGLPITFKAKLSKMMTSPDLYLKMRVIDEQMVMTQGVSAGNSCNTSVNGIQDFYISAKSDGEGVYYPSSSAKPVSQFALPGGSQIAAVDTDGKVTVPGISLGSNKYYTFILKGPKTRGVKVLEHYKTDSDAQTLFDWTDKPLDAGDLPDPNTGSQQDCTINSIDVNQIISRLSVGLDPDVTPDPADLNICDVDYNRVCNGQDVSHVVTNLQIKPDDD